MKCITSLKNKNLLKSNKNNPGGFTLIEVLVVLAILAILMTIAFIFLGDQGKRARLATATSSVKSAMTIAAACQVIEGTVQEPPDGIRGPGDTICTGAASISENSVWPQLPEKCRYCGRDGTKINFECQNADCASVSGKSFCDYNNTQCVQEN